MKKRDEGQGKRDDLLVVGFLHFPFFIFHSVQMENGKWKMENGNEK